tara:strand:+ start:37 stop:768 length:732 start_codon:yes stop_codon:yes gene_type:complete
MHILYRITYLPHVESNTEPFYYVGSKYDYTGNYWGSPASKQRDWYTGELSISDWWKKEVSKNIDSFRFEVLQSFDDITPQDLVMEEYTLHTSLDVRNLELYFNRAIATKGFCAVRKTDITKKKISETTQRYWDSDTEEVRKRRKDLIERNKRVKSEELSSRWKTNPEQFDITHDKRDKLSQSVKNAWENGVYDKRKKKAGYPVMIEGVYYSDSATAAEAVGITKHNVYSRCKSKNFKNWIIVN